MSRRMGSGRAFFAMAALLFAASSTLTIVCCWSMSAMGEMPMPGDWSMSTAWTRMCGRTWAGVGVSFLGMWTAMMPAMMLPSFAPMLWRYRMTLGEPGDTRIAGLTMRVGAGYFAVWIGSAMAIFPLGAALASLATQLPMLARAVPLATGVVVLAAGALQFTAWKARHLACCRKAPERVDGLSVDSVKAWRDGVRLGLHCSGCCAGFTAALLAVGVMDLRAMACVSAAITLERLGPDGARVARLIGVAVVATGSFLIVRAALPG